jgi:hypothetical protein
MKYMANKKLDFNFQLKNLDGTNLADAGKQLAGWCANHTGTEPIKYYEWSKDLFANGFVELDVEDTKKLHNFIENYSVAAAIRGQLIEVIDKRE